VRGLPRDERGAGRRLESPRRAPAQRPAAGAPLQRVRRARPQRAHVRRDEAPVSEFWRGWFCCLCVMVLVRHVRRVLWPALRERVLLAFDQRGGW
jgi:hypothetical protein